ncbi:MAG: hypothetical protein BWX50_01168 [Euryarchaeota archaeon ADurb.Bin009]|nr:MAG: hypothetical protein BWX50_01168 [Euryarchaeota archaeon ADurb.Bin009]
MAAGKSIGVDCFRRGGVGDPELLCDMGSERPLEDRPPLGKRSIQQGLAVDIQYIKDPGDELDLLHHRVHLVLAPEPADDELERHGPPVPDGDRLPVQDHVAVGRLHELPGDVGEALRDLLETAGVDPADVAHLVELEPAPVVLVLDRDLAVVGNLPGDGACLGKHHLHRPERFDRHAGERIRVPPGKEGDLAKVVHRLVGMLDQADVEGKRPRDGVADVPLAHPYPELFEHQPREVPPFKRAGVPEEALRDTELLLLRPLPSRRRHPPEFAVDVDEVEFLYEERRLLFSREEILDGKAGVAGGVDRLADGLPLSPDDVGHRVVEEVGAYAEFFGAPVGKDPAHDEPDEDGEFVVAESGEDAGDLLDHIQAPRNPLEALADAGELQKLHTHLLKYFPAG